MIAVMAVDPGLAFIGYAVMAIHPAYLNKASKATIADKVLLRCAGLVRTKRSPAVAKKKKRGVDDIRDRIEHIVGRLTSRWSEYRGTAAMYVWGCETWQLRGKAKGRLNNSSIQTLTVYGALLGYSMSWPTAMFVPIHPSGHKKLAVPPAWLDATASPDPWTAKTEDHVHDACTVGLATLLAVKKLLKTK